MKMEDIKTIGIAGAGTMGASMAKIFGACGFRVVVYSRRQETLDKAKDLTKGENHIIFAAPGDLTAFADCDLLVESIVENLEAKHIFWRAVSDIVREDAILTTNTSGLSISEIAQAVSKPERFCGFHWFNPSHIIPLIEVISGDATDPATAEIVYALAEKIGKKPIYVSKDAPGFIANRIQLAVLRECLHIRQEGIGSVEDIDRCMKYGLGFRYACLGPFEVCDQGGLDTFYHIASYLWRDLANDENPDGTYLGELYRAGCYGVKTEKGFYDYTDGKAREAVEKRDRMYAAMKKVNL